VSAFTLFRSSRRAIFSDITTRWGITASWGLTLGSGATTTTAATSTTATLWHRSFVGYLFEISLSFHFPGRCNRTWLISTSLRWTETQIVHIIVTIDFDEWLVINRRFVST
jgi:hypothetical protein